jgi:putative oxidoreductase
LPLPETFAVRTPVATEVRRRERRWLDWINPSPLSKGALVARLGVGTIMLMHGLQKFGLFGGPGWEATMRTFTFDMGIPPPLAAVAILTEAVGGACLIIGVAARFMALAVAIEMLVAAGMVHLKNGFFMNWYMKPGIGHGIEMNLALVALAVVVLLEGAGSLALDTRIARALAVNEATPKPAQPPTRSTL